jgi:hypothetical protein
LSRWTIRKMSAFSGLSVIAIALKVHESGGRANRIVGSESHSDARKRLT